MLRKKGMLLLLPNLLGEHRYHEVFLPSSVDKAVATLDGLIAESDKGGRRFLSRFKTKKKVHEIPLALFNKNTPDDHLDFLLEPLVNGQRWGLVSDAGLPCIADPGAKVVFRARQRGIAVQAFVGPSSIFLALMLSGLPGQQFAFHGYLDKDAKRRQKQLIDLEKRSRCDQAVQMFMEAPHRNSHILQALMEILQDDTLLCVCWDLTLPTQGVVSQEVRVWKKTPLPNIHKKPALFLLFINR